MAVTSAGRKTHVLLVASEADEARHWDKALRHAGAATDVDVAHTPILARRRLDRGGIDAVVFDLDQAKAVRAARRCGGWPRCSRTCPYWP